MADLFDDYLLGSAWDEMFARTGDARDECRPLHDALSALSIDDLEERRVARDRACRDEGITFSLSGEERPFPLDLIPRVITAEEWAVVEAGVAQRVRALEAFLADAYGAGAVFGDGIVPRRRALTSRHFHRVVAGVTPANGVRIHVAGIDLVRGADGRLRVLEDNLRTPSGISYVIENRRAMAYVLPELFATYRVRPVATYPRRLHDALTRAGPRHVDDPTVVVLTPGVYNSAYFEHVFLARQMGVELVEGRDLVCRDNVVYLRTTAGDRRVDVVYRRVDDDFLDPVHFRPDSLVGCPGLVNAARAGNVTIANAVGNGIADDKLIYSYVPELIRYYLGEDPVLENVTTYRLADPDHLADALARIDRLVFKPVDASGGYGLVMGPQATDEELTHVRRSVEANLRDWIAQEVVTLSTVPTDVGGRILPRHVDLRPFAINDGDKVWVVPGGLTRVALGKGSLVVNSSQGGGSKDTWVLAPPGDRAADRAGARRGDGGLPVGHRQDQGPAGGSAPPQTQQQQQQQVREGC